MIEINKKVMSIDKAIHRGKNFMNLALIITLLNIVFFAGLTYYIFENTANNIYVLDDQGDINPAYKTDVLSNLEAEADNHFRLFYSTFFSYDPVNVDGNVAKGLELGGKSIKNLWKVYKQKNWYNQIKSNNIVVKSIVDSTFFDLKSYPYRAKIYGHQTLRSADYTERRTLNISCEFIKVSRVKQKNPHGLSIEKIYSLDINKVE